MEKRRQRLNLLIVLKTPSMDFHDSVDHLQQTMGNQAIQRVIQSNKGFDFPKIAIQPKLKVTQPGDANEQEADRVAEQILKMSLSDAATSSTTFVKKGEQVSRKCSACEMNKKEEENLDISRKPATISNQETMDEITEGISSVRPREGFPLDASTKGFMESRFGFDFSNVRIHSGEMAPKSAQSINALAYTFGEDIVFNAGYYQPNTLEGKRLIAHELTHVTQQDKRYATEAVVQRQTFGQTQEDVGEMVGEHGPTVQETLGLEREKFETKTAIVNSLQKPGRDFINEVRDGATDAALFGLDQVEDPSAKINFILALSSNLMWAFSSILFNFHPVLLPLMIIGEFGGAGGFNVKSTSKGPEILFERLNQEADSLEQNMGPYLQLAAEESIRREISEPYLQDQILWRIMVPAIPYATRRLEIFRIVRVRVIKALTRFNDDWSEWNSQYINYINCDPMFRSCSHPGPFNPTLDFGL